MNNVHRPETAEFGTVTVATVALGSTHARRTITTTCAGPLTALALRGRRQVARVGRRDHSLVCERPARAA